MKIDEIVVALADYTKNHDYESFNRFTRSLGNDELLKLKEFGFTLEQFTANELNRRRK